jgi:hypothetical protein
MMTHVTKEAMELLQKAESAAAAERFRARLDATFVDETL